MTFLNKDLYKGGLQRVLFLPFIDLLKEQVSVVDLNSGIDYRLTGTHSATVFNLFVFKIFYFILFVINKIKIQPFNRRSEGKS